MRSLSVSSRYSALARWYSTDASRARIWEPSASFRSYLTRSCGVVSPHVSRSTYQSRHGVHSVSIDWLHPLVKQYATFPHSHSCLCCWSAI